MRDKTFYYKGTQAATTVMAAKTSLENKHLGKCDYFVISASSSQSLLLSHRARCKWTGRSAVEVNIENERFTVVWSRYH